MASLFDIGVSGLRAQQSALNIVGQNITNANTPGYTRQRVDIQTQIGGLSAGLGSGVTVGSVTRIADAFVDEQIRSDKARHAELASFTQNVQQLEASLFDSQFGIDSAMRDFFDAVQNSSNEPTDLAMREFVISAGEALATRFRGVTDRSWLQAQDIVGSLESSVVRVNELAQLVVQINERIAGLQDQSSTGALNLMIDQREGLLKELSGLVNINTVEQDDGQVNVFVGKGQPLVLGADVALMEVTGDGDIALRPVGTDSFQIVTSALSGGEIGGVIRYREEVLWPTQNELGRLAAGIALAVNEQHQLGIDTQGEFGGDLFRDVNDPDLIGQRVDYLAGASGSGASNNVDIGRVNVYIDDPFKGAATDYEVYFDGAAEGSFTVKRRSDGETVFRGTSFVPPHEISFDGITVEFASGTFAPGDTFLVRPYADFGTRLEMVLSDPSSLALGSPIQINEAPNNSGGTQLISTGTTDATHPIFANLGQDSEGNFSPPILIRFVTDDEFVLLDNTDPSQPVPLEPDPGLQRYLANAENQMLPATPGSSIVQTSGPALSLLGTPTLVTDFMAGTNGYPSGLLSLDYSQSDYDEDLRSIALPANTTAQEIAQQLSNLPGVVASAKTSLSITDLVNFDSGTAVELAINGELISGFATLNDLADAISTNASLSEQGITAKSDGTTLSLESRYGDDLTLHFQGDPNESITVANNKGVSTMLNGNVSGVYRSITVGGELSVILDPGISLGAQYVGIFAANPEHERADLGMSIVMSGAARAGDEFRIGFNKDGTGDNRNALAMAAISDQSLIGIPARPFAEMFGSVIQQVGVQSSQSSINRDAAGVLLDQSEAFRESVSGVNLDEEAANLIEHEQAYNASAQVIAVARDIFDILLNSVS
ncbi:MAG: flagellar hook-associated protein FlgK [Pseudomonadota bacterium]